MRKNKGVGERDRERVKERVVIGLAHYENYTLLSSLSFSTHELK